MLRNTAVRQWGMLVVMMVWMTALVRMVLLMMIRMTVEGRKMVVVEVMRL